MESRCRDTERIRRGEEVKRPNQRSNAKGISADVQNSGQLVNEGDSSSGIRRARQEVHIRGISNFDVSRAACHNFLGISALTSYTEHGYRALTAFLYATLFCGCNMFDRAT